MDTINYLCHNLHADIASLYYQKGPQVRLVQSTIYHDTICYSHKTYTGYML